MKPYPVVLRSSSDIDSYKHSEKPGSAYIGKTSWMRHISRRRIPERLASRAGLTNPKPVVVLWGPDRLDAAFMFESSCGCMASPDDLDPQNYVPSPHEIAEAIAAIRVAALASKADVEGFDFTLRLSGSCREPVSTKFFGVDRYPHDDAQLCDCPYWMHELLDLP